MIARHRGKVHGVMEFIFKLYGKFNMLDFPSVNKYYYNGRMSKDDYLFIIDNYSEIKEWYLKRLERIVKIFSLRSYNIKRNRKCLYSWNHC